MQRRLSQGDFVGGLVAGVLTGLGVGLLLAPRRGQVLGAVQGSDLPRRVAASGPLIFEAGLLLLTQVRPILGRAAWSLVHLSGRMRSRVDGA